ncbi:MAG: BatA domain-containing protein [Planctomycetota bacterium]
MSFIAPIMLAGLVFASAPLIIHLLNRRKFRTIEWAPMHYLKLTLRTNRRRLRLEQWILLAIRTIVILLLIFAIARPLIAGSGAAGWLSLGERTSRVILIDDSVSMTLEVDGVTAFDRAVEQAAALIEGTGGQDSLTVATTSSLDDPLQRDTVLTGDAGPQLAERVRKLGPTATANNWAATLSQLAEQLGASSYRSREVRIFTDQRREGWSPQASAEAARLAEMGVKVTVINVGRPPQGNASLIELEQVTGVALANTQVRINATLRTDGDAALSSRQATLSVDGEPSTVALPEVAPGQDVNFELKLTFSEPGQHTVELSLPDDRMLGDNTRSLVVNVEEGVRILLVNGQPGIEARESEMYYLATSLAAGDTPYLFRTLTDEEWFDSPIIGNYDLIVLANVAEVPAGRARQLTEAVEAGMGLMVFTGGQVDPDNYNTVLYNNGRGVLPGMIDVGVETQATGMVIESYTDSPIQELFRVQEKTPSLLREMAPTRFTPVELPGDPELMSRVRVLAAWNDQQRSPAILEKRVGDGRVLMFTTTADTEWSRWPADVGTYFLTVREAALVIAGVGRSTGNLTAGEPLVEGVSFSSPPTRATVVRPGSDTATPAIIDRDEANSRVQVRYPDTTQPGIYTMSWDVPGAEQLAERSYAISFDPAESNLDPLTNDELTQLLKGVDLTLIELGADDGEGGLGGKEIWRTLAFGLLALLVIESAFAAWVGREH